MTNVGLLPGTSSLEEMIAATDDGLLVDTNRSWSIDDKRLNFQFGCEIGWEIKNGKRGRMLKNPTYTGIGPRFWGSPRHARQRVRVDVLGDAELRQGSARPDRPHRAPLGSVSIPRRAGRSDRMSDGLLDVCERVLARVGAGAEAEVTVSGGTDALTRFATSFIHQNVADAAQRVHLRIALDGRVAEAVGNQTDDDALDRLVRSATDAARLRPVDPGWPGLAPPAPAPAIEHWDEATAQAEPDARASRVGAFVNAADGLETAGFCSTNGEVVAFANSTGQRLSGRTTRRHHRRHRAYRPPPTAAVVPPPSASRISMEGSPARRPPGARTSRRIHPTSSPVATRWSWSLDCVVDVLTFLALHGFNGRAVEEGRSFAKLGEAQFDAVHLACR